jgi:PleD family two-component response regulator
VAELLTENKAFFSSVPSASSDEVGGVYLSNQTFFFKEMHQQSGFEKMERTILIIDDDEKLNRLLTNFLSEFGFKTLTAIHPEDGLKTLNQKYFDQCH